VNSWNKEIYSYRETFSTATNHTAHYIYNKILHYPHALSSHFYRTTSMQIKTSAKPLSTWPIKISWSHLLGQQE